MFARVCARTPRRLGTALFRLFYVRPSNTLLADLIHAMRNEALALSCGFRDPHDFDAVEVTRDLGSGANGCSPNAVVYMIFELLKITLEALREITGLRIVGAAITPSVSWIENLSWNIGAGLRH